MFGQVHERISTEQRYTVITLCVYIYIICIYIYYQLTSEITQTTVKCSTYVLLYTYAFAHICIYMTLIFNLFGNI